jgi:PAS domain S-box-containing protein
MVERAGGDQAKPQSEAEIKASVQARLAQLLAASPAVIYSFSAQGDFAPTYVSENITRLFGYAPRDYLEDPNFWRSHVHPDDLPRVEKEVAALFGNGKAALEYRFRKKNGEYIWVGDKQQMLRDEAGAPLEVVGSWSDISDRKAAEAAEDALKARLALLLESAPAVIYSFKAHGDFAPTFVSENIKRLLGYCPADYLQGASFWRDRVHPEDLLAVEGEQAKVFSEDRHKIEYRFRKKDGSYVWLSDEQHLIRDEAGKPREIVGSLSDVSVRRHAEQAESAAQARFALMLHSAPAVVYSFRTDEDFTPTFVSDNIRRVLGYHPNEYLEHADFWRARVHPEDLAGVEADQAKLFESGRHVAEYRFRKKDGSYAWVSDEQHLLRDANGQPVEVVGSWSEVTERKTAEQAALAQSEQRLLDAIESISEGFSLYDVEDRLVLSNRKYGELFDHGEGAPKPGATFEEIIRAAVKQGLIPEAETAQEAWIKKRLSQHRNPIEPILQQRGDGRWLQINERSTENAGTVAVYTDMTEIKESEQRAAAANQLIMQSLRYASRIQAAILPAARELSTVAADHFLIWEPRDIVGGDFFWFQPISEGYAVIVGDCTGHGVPGAFMTLIAWGLLERMLNATPSNDPGRLLAGLHRGVQALLGQDEQTGDTDDGLEAGVCFVNTDERKMHFSGARFSLWRAKSGKVIEIKGDRKGVGYRRYPQKTTYSNFHLDLDEDDSFYMTTDGLIEQIGGPRGRSFGKSRFQALLRQTSGQPMAEQAAFLKKTIQAYQGKQARRDDLTVLGFVPRMQ